MALTLATNVQVYGHTTPAGNQKESTGKDILGCFMSFEMTGTYDQAANGQLTGAVAAIQNSRRDGRTVALLAQGIALAAPGKEAGAVVGVKTLAKSTNDITFEVTTADLSTEHAAAAFGAFDQPITIFVAYTLA